MNAKKRLLKYLSVKSLNKNNFYSITGLSNGFLDKGENVSSEKLEIIGKCFIDLDLTWVVTGEGDMLKKPTGLQFLVDSLEDKGFHALAKSTNELNKKVKRSLGDELTNLSNEVKPSNDDSSITLYSKSAKPVTFTPIPLLSLSAKAGEIIESFNHPEVCGTIQIPEQIARAGAIAIPVEGDSMFPTVHNGDIAVCTRIFDVKSLFPNKIYIIYMQERESAVIKRYSHEDNEHIHLNSDNAHYSPLILPKQDVGAILELRGTFSTNFPLPIHERLKKRNAKIEELEEQLNTIHYHYQEKEREMQKSLSEAQKKIITLLEK